MLAGVIGATGINGAAQAVTFAEAQRLQVEVAVPRWRSAADDSRQQRANPTDAATAERWQRLDALTDPAIGKAPLEQIALAATDAQRSVDTRWLRWRVLAENADARYSFVYATQRLQMRDAQDGAAEQDALLFHLHAKLALTLDAVRCTDRSKANHLQTWYTAQEAARPLELKTARLSPSARSALVLEAIAIETMRGERPAMGWLCPRREPDKATTTAEALPRFLPDAEWRRQRAELLERLTQDAVRTR